MAHLPLSDVIPGMKTADMIMASNGQMLLPKGSILNEKVIEILKKKDIKFVEVMEDKPEEEFCAVYTEDMLAQAEKEIVEVMKVTHKEDPYIQELKSSAIKIYLKRMSSGSKN